jgi:hypothetical protein
MRLAIHQPNFFPWVGLFHKIACVDTFMFFDHVQAPNGKSWLSRNRILLNGEVRWLTIPIVRQAGQRISDVRINYGENFARKHLGTLRQAYGKSPCFDEVYGFLEALYGRRFEVLTDFNEEFIRSVCARTGIRSQFCRSSDVVREFPELLDETGNEIVLNLSVRAGASVYLSGTGCTDFIRPDSFPVRGVGFEFQQFDHPRYPQSGGAPFISHLSSLDALFSVGFSSFERWGFSLREDVRR